jgi:hypothetical protein
MRLKRFRLPRHQSNFSTDHLVNGDKRIELLMMCCWVVFGEIFGSVEAALSPVHVKSALADAVANPVKAHVNRFGTLFLTVSLAMPALVLLSVWMGVGSWGCPSSLRHIRIGQASLPLWYTAASSNSVALDRTSRMIWHKTLMAPLEGGGGSVAKRGLACLGGR